MKVCRILILFVATLSTSLFSMEQTKPRRLEAKFPFPINQEEFLSADLREYTQDETAHFACLAVTKKEPLKILEKLFDEAELTANIRDCKGNPVLSLAIVHDHREAVQFLLNKKAKVVYTTDRGNFHQEHTEYPHAITPWQSACLMGKQNYLQLIYERVPAEYKSAILNSKLPSLRKLAPFTYALKNKKPELAAFIFNQKEHNVYLDDYEDYDFLIASWHDATYLIPFYTKFKLVLESRINRILSSAVNAGNVTGVRFLLTQGARVNAQMCTIAALNEDMPMFDLLRETGVSLKAKDCEEYHLPLHECLMSPRLKSKTPLVLLLNAGAQADEHKQGNSQQPIHLIANMHGDLSIKKKAVEEFRMRGVKLDTQDDQGRTILHYTSDKYMNKDTHFMFHLLDLGAHADVKDQNGQTPFLLFCDFNKSFAKLYHYVETCHPDLNTQDDVGNTPLAFAAKHGKKSHPLIAYLISMGADKRASCQRMLRNACNSLNVELVRTLIENYGAQVMHKDADHITPLIASIAAHNFAHKNSYKERKIVKAKLEILELLIRHGAEINTQDKQGKTALHYAVQQDRPRKQLIEKLLELGADPAIRDNCKKTPLEISMIGATIYSQDLTITKLLLSHTREKPIILSTGQSPREYLLSTPNESTFDEGSWHRKLLELFMESNR